MRPRCKKNDSQGGSQVGSQGGSLSARSFDLARPGLAPPLEKRKREGKVGRRDGRGKGWNDLPYNLGDLEMTWLL